MKKLILILMIGSLFAQYDLGKIHLKNGFYVEGKNLVYDNNSVSIDVKGVTKTFTLDEINSIHSGETQIFNLYGAFIGWLGVGIPFAIFSTMEAIDIGIVVGGGVTMGLITPFLLQSLGKDRTKWNLLYAIK